MFLICSASRIYSFCLLFWYSNIVMFSVRIFRNNHLGNIYVQRDGISMRSVLSPIFSNFYMFDLENRISNSIKNPLIYLRYVDDILILIKNINEINMLQNTFKKNSVLNFTHELNKNNKISFLDVLIDSNNNNFTTSTYKKPSNNNSCTLNFKSECSFRYKKAIINKLISHAKLISSSKTIFYKEIENIKQALINNGFPNYIVDEQIKVWLKMLTNKIDTVLLHPVNKHISNFFLP